MNQNPHLIQLVIALLVLGGGFIRWAATKLKEKADQKRRADDVERRKMEVLRTGRDPGIATVGAAATIAQRQRQEAADRQQQDAARRQAQIEEFRRRQAERARQRTAQAPEAVKTAPRQASTVPQRRLPPIITIAGSTGPTVPQRAQTPRPVFKPRSRPVAPAPELPKPSPPPPVRAAAPAPAPAPPAAAGPLVLPGPPRTAAEWRRAIVVNEILSPALANRSPDLRTPF